MRVAALVKQVPAFQEMRLGSDRRLVRDGLDLEMNPYCRRAVSQAVELAAAIGDGTVTVFTLGPPSAAEVLREAIAWGDEHSVVTDGVLITDPAFAGSDTLATARALAAALEHVGRFDLVLVGRNSVDADTGQVGPELAELLDLPFATGARYLSVQGKKLHIRCEHDDGWAQVEMALPAVVSTAERLIEPCKVESAVRAQVPSSRLRTLSAAELGPGPWGAAGSPTTVGAVRTHPLSRAHVVLTGTVEDQVREAVRLLHTRGALHPPDNHEADRAPVPNNNSGNTNFGPVVAMIVEPDRLPLTRELLGAAADLADAIRGHVVALSSHDIDPALLGSWGADRIVIAYGASVEEDMTNAVAAWAAGNEPWAVLVASTAWGREVGSRVAARMGAGLTGDAIALEERGGRLVAWKPAFGGQFVAPITATSAMQMATVRAGVLLPRPPRDYVATVEQIVVRPRHRIRVLARTRDDDLDTLATAHTVVGIGHVIAPDEYPRLDPLLAALDAELGATRKVTDRGWLPRARQIGITGRAIAPRLYVAIGVSGKFNHMIGVRSAGTILAINPQPNAPVFEAADIGVVADWHDAVPLLVTQLDEATP